jgi:hypothetical protein
MEDAVKVAIKVGGPDTKAQISAKKGNKQLLSKK